MRWLVFALVLAAAIFLGSIFGIIVSDLFLNDMLGVRDPWDVLVGFAAGASASVGVLALARALLTKIFSKCPSCASYVPAEATVCRVCKRDM